MGVFFYLSFHKLTKVIECNFIITILAVRKRNKKYTIMKQIKNFDKYLFRASAVGNLCVGIKSGRTKPGNLSKTAQTYLQKLFKEEYFGKKKEITTKQMDKGVLVEDISITLYSNVMNQLFFKNKEHFKNEFVKGTPDTIKDRIIDIKSSWNLDTFPMFETKLTDIYYWQVMTYMWLTGVHSGEVAYCLVDTPEHMIFRALENYAHYNGLQDWSGEDEDKIRNNMTFSDIPEKHRVKRFEVLYNENDIEILKLQVLAGREYLNKLLKIVEL